MQNKGGSSRSSFYIRTDEYPVLKLRSSNADPVIKTRSVADQGFKYGWIRIRFSIMGGFDPASRLKMFLKSSFSVNIHCAKL